MPLPPNWATPQDFATLFQYLWHRDFPISPVSPGAKRADWTIHIGIVVRKIADLMGLVARFEEGGRSDAVLRSTDGEEIAAEWEWNGVWGNELEKLKNHKFAYNKEKDRLLKYAVLITYTHTENKEKVYAEVLKKWEGARWPLLLILVDLDESKEWRSGKEFNNISMSLFPSGEPRKDLRTAPAFRWRVPCSRWSVETMQKPQ